MERDRRRDREKQREMESDRERHKRTESDREKQLYLVGGKARREDFYLEHGGDLLLQCCHRHAKARATRRFRVARSVASAVARCFLGWDLQAVIRNPTS